MQQLYLAKPGGQKEGPFTLDQINRDLAAERYGEDDYWAWHEGLPQWMPLHAIPGVTGKVSSPAPAAVAPAPAFRPAQPVAEPQKPAITPRPAPAPAKPAPVAAFETTAPSAPARPAPEVATTKTASSAPAPAVVEQPSFAAKTELASGLPFSALEQIFIFTTGEGRSVFESQTVTQKLQGAVGQDVNAIRENVSVGVIGRTDVAVSMLLEGTIPDKAWRAISAIKPEIGRKAKEDLYEVCVRPFSIDTADSIAVFLLYNKEKMQLAPA